MLALDTGMEMSGIPGLVFAACGSEEVRLMKSMKERGEMKALATAARLAPRGTDISRSDENSEQRKKHAYAPGNLTMPGGGCFSTAFRRLKRSWPGSSVARRHCRVYVQDFDFL